MLLNEIVNKMALLAHDGRAQNEVKVKIGKCLVTVKDVKIYEDEIVIEA